MAQFNRINRDHGLGRGAIAFIRDTNVSTNDIVRLTRSGWSQADILEAYPMLEAEDLLQALAFSVDDLLQSIAYWRHEGLTPLTHIKGYSEILADKTEIVESSEIDEAQRQEIMTIIVENTWRAIAHWHQLRRWTNLHFAEFDNEYNVLQISTIMEKLRQSIIREEPTAILEFEADDVSTSVKANETIISALLNIVIAGKDTFNSLTLVNIFPQDDKMIFTIKRSFKYADDRLSYLIEPYTPLAMAATYIYQNDSSLSIEQKDTDIYFMFSLLVVED